MSSTDPIMDDAARLEARAAFADSPQMDELLSTLKERGYAVEAGGEMVDPDDDDDDENGADGAEVSTEEATEGESGEGGPAAVVEGEQDTSAQAAAAVAPGEPEDAVVEVEETKVEVGGEEDNEETGGVIGAGGMADTRDPETLDHDDPRKSISAAPSFEEYLKARASA